MLLTSLKSYDRSQFVKDVTAGIIVLHLVSDRKPESSLRLLQDLSSLHLAEAVSRLPDLLLHLQLSLQVSLQKTGWTDL